MICEAILLYLPDVCSAGFWLREGMIALKSFIDADSPSLQPEWKILTRTQLDLRQLIHTGEITNINYPFCTFKKKIVVCYAIKVI